MQFVVGGSPPSNVKCEYSLHSFDVIWAEPGEMEIFAQGDPCEEEKPTRRCSNGKGKRQTVTEQVVAAEDPRLRDSDCEGNSKR